MHIFTTYTQDFVGQKLEKRFDLKYNNETAYITAKKEGSLYVVLQSDNGLTSTAYVKAVEEGEDSQSIIIEEIKFSSDKFEIFVEEKKRLTDKVY